jgi:hypothetical protein
VKCIQAIRAGAQRSRHIDLAATVMAVFFYALIAAPAARGAGISRDIRADAALASNIFPGSLFAALVSRPSG